jgi:hypothetical protein
VKHGSFWGVPTPPRNEWSTNTVVRVVQFVAVVRKLTGDFCTRTLRGAVAAALEYPKIWAPWTYDFPVLVGHDP